MNPENNAVCPYIKGSREGARCERADDYIRTIVCADIHLCMSENYRYCAVYNSSAESV